MMIASDERQQTPRLGDLFAKLALGVSKGDPIGALSDFLHAASDTMSQENSQYLLSCVVEEVRDLLSRFDALEMKHKEFLERNWISLFVDADRKARRTRGKERVRRIASILCSALNAEPVQAVDATEELMRLAMDLSDTDVLVLKTLLAALARQLDMQRPEDPNFGRVIPAPVEIQGIKKDEVLSSYAKLESLGLIMNNSDYARAVRSGIPQYWSCVVLDRGRKFVDLALRELKS